jgi:hypothetical protein
MSNFLKHVGKVGDRKVAIIFREIPGEEHMALVVYTELLNQNIHDPMMMAIESPQGQQAKELAEHLNKSYTRDGKIILQVLHSEGMMKKINTNQVMVTPTPTTKVRLDELNKILNEMSQGEEAVKRLAELDASRGLQDPADVARRIKENKAAKAQPPVQATIDGALGNNELANNLRQQATRMAAEAKGLLAESDRLMKEAAQMEGINTEANTEKVKKTRTKKATVTG